VTTRRLTRWLVALAFVALAPCDATRFVAAQQPSVVFDFLNRYQKGDLRVAQETSDIPFLANELVKHGEKWIDAAGPDAAPARRLAAATFGLELADGTSFDEDWFRVRQVIEWGCRLLQKQPRQDAERLWYLASISLAEGAHDVRLLGAHYLWLLEDRPEQPDVSHLDHARDRFPDDSRFAFASLVSQESTFFAVEGDRDEPWESDASLNRRAASELDAKIKLSARLAIRRLIDRFGEFRRDASLSAEADLRIGRLLFVLHEPARAISQFDEVLRKTHDPFLVHLAHLFAGRALEQLGDLDRARAAYEESLKVVPAAQAASMLLAARFSADGRRTDAQAVMQSSFSVDSRARDPWRLYGYGSYRFWPQYIAALRERVWR
jgi:tetratricopeptide (TPR) repeat protein